MEQYHLSYSTKGLNLKPPEDADDMQNKERKGKLDENVMQLFLIW